MEPYTPELPLADLLDDDPGYGDRIRAVVAAAERGDVPHEADAASGCPVLWPRAWVRGAVDRIKKLRSRLPEDLYLSETESDRQGLGRIADWWEGLKCSK